MQRRKKDMGRERRGEEWGGKRGSDGGKVMASC